MKDLLWTIFEASINAIEILLVCILFFRKLGTDSHKKKPLLAVISGGIILWVSTVVMNMLKIPTFATPIISVALFIAYAFVCFGGTATFKILWSGIAVIAIVANNFLNSFVFGVIAGDLSSSAEQSNFTRAEALLLYSLFNVIAFTALYLLGNKKRELPNLHKILNVVLVAINVASMSILISKSIEFSAANIKFEWCTIVCGLILLVSIGQVILFLSLSTIYEDYLKAQTMLRISELEREHFQDISDLYAKIQKWQHDYTNNMQILSTLTASDGSEALTDFIQSMTLCAPAMTIVESGHRIVDTAISNKIRLAENHGINVSYSIVLPKNITIPEFELCTVISNLFDNAIEAVKALPQEQAVITFELIHRKNSLCLLIENPCNGKYIRDADGFLTTKTNKNAPHGLGLKIVADMIEKCDGSIAIDADKTNFSVMIAIPSEVKND